MFIYLFETWWYFCSIGVAFQSIGDDIFFEIHAFTLGRLEIICGQLLLGKCVHQKVFKLMILFLQAVY